MSNIAVKTNEELATEFVELQKDAHAHPEKYRGWEISIPKLQKVTGGFRPGWLCYVMGGPKVGKTTLLTTAQVGAMRQGLKTMYFSLEEPLQLVASRIFAQMGPLSRVKFRDITMDQVQDYPVMYQVADELKKMPLSYFVEGAYTEDAMVELLEKFDPDMVFMDYLQLQMYPNVKNGKVEEVSNASKFWLRVARGAHTLGHKKPFCMVAAQLNEQGNPLWSRDLNRDGDLTLKLLREPDANGDVIPGEVNLFLEYFRHGESFINIPCMVQGDISRIVERAPIQMSSPIQKPAKRPQTKSNFSRKFS